ncbi:hypothetical protein ACOSQ2_002358 [Xanthoceras sorbifolium]
MESKWFLISCFFLVLMRIVNSSNGYKFFVGGKDGWVVKPCENYNHWAERMRFQVNDTLYFKYKKGSDSVLVVTKDDYDSCNTKSPIQSLADGDSIFNFDHSGPYFFISGNADNCKKNQKLIVVVMAVRNKTHHHQTPPSPSPSPLPSPPSPDTPSSPPAESPKSVAETPEAPVDPHADGDVPTPAPSNSGSMGLGCSVGSVLGYSIGVNVLFGSFLGMI